MKRKNGFTLIELLIVLAIFFILAVIIGGGARDSVGVYGYFYSKDVSGHLESVTSAMPSGSIVGTNFGTPVFQASIVIKDNNGVYVTFSTEDRQWASFVGDRAIKKCVKARIFPYAPWRFSKAGTYHSGRLLSVKDCQ
jgi:prepilin-type N-terminal cleavage/methylation domain-containing protein